MEVERTSCRLATNVTARPLRNQALFLLDFRMDGMLGDVDWRSQEVFVGIAVDGQVRVHALGQDPGAVGVRPGAVRDGDPSATVGAEAGFDQAFSGTLSVLWTVVNATGDDRFGAELDLRCDHGFGWKRLQATADAASFLDTQFDGGVMLSTMDSFVASDVTVSRPSLDRPAVVALAGNRVGELDLPGLPTWKFEPGGLGPSSYLEATLDDAVLSARLSARSATPVEGSALPSVFAWPFSLWVWSGLADVRMDAPTDDLAGLGIEYSTS